MVLRLLYLMLGLMLKETGDAVNLTYKDLIEKLEKKRTAVETYRGVPALLAGTAEAHRAIQEAQHAQVVAPELRKIDGQIRWLQRMRPATWVLFTFVTLLAIIYFESRNVESLDGPTTTPAVSPPITKPLVEPAEPGSR